MPLVIQPKFVEVAVGLPVRATFHYKVPKPLQERAAAGKRVWVPFGNRQRLGTIVAGVEKPEVSRLKSVTQILDEEPILDSNLLALTRWMADTYQAGWGETIAAALPGPLRRGRTFMTPRSEEPLPKMRPTSALALTSEQKEALAAIEEAIRRRRHQVFLLHGITASGKTEIYLQTIEELLRQGKGSIVLVPEIALTSQTIERFQARFGMEKVAVLHSGMLESRRLQEWHRLREGKARVAVGARSALFAPVRSLGLIVIDEEHEPSYKQEDAPRYHAREAAIERARLAGALVLLGSATPAIETYHRALLKKYRLLTLRSRIEEVPLPEVEIVDMRREFSSGRRGRIFSRQLEEGLHETVSQRQQAILFLNRRGFSPFVHCRGCGQALRCKSCQVALTYHITERALICHYCHAQQPVPEICPNCRSEYIRFQGIGTQKVESELARSLPQARIARMDADATEVRGSHARILEAFRRHEVDVLVGTQMVAKGLDFPRVTLVGVISADTALNLPDFRSAERTFNLLTQVAGRAGRGSLPGRVIIQTCAPHHYAIQAARLHDYASFFKQELEIRRQCGLPPFTRLILLTVRGMKEVKAQESAQRLADLLRESLPRKTEILGPSPAPVPKVRRRYLWQVLLKTKNYGALQEPLAHLLQRFHPLKGCRLAVDVDPL